jgi:hypothetical protein
MDALRRAGNVVTMVEIITTELVMMILPNVSRTRIRNISVKPQKSTNHA